MSSGTLLGIARFTFHAGKVDEFKRLSRECMAIVKEKDTGTLRYEIFFNADESEAMVIEEYVDVNALIEHGAHLGDELSSTILATASVHGEVLGQISPEFRTSLDGSPVQAFVPFLSMDA